MYSFFNITKLSSLYIDILPAPETVIVFVPQSIIAVL